MSLTKVSWPQRLTAESDDREAAIVELCAFLIRGLRSGLSGRTGSDEVFIEDIAQMSVLRILDRIGTFKGRSAFTTWALSIAMRVAFTELRRMHWKDISLDELNEKEWLVREETESSPDPSQQAARNSLISLMHDLIQSDLTARQREVLLCELKGMPQIAVAEKINISPNAVYKLAHDARKALKRAMINGGYGPNQVLIFFPKPT